MPWKENKNEQKQHYMPNLQLINSKMINLRLQFDIFSCVETEKNLLAPPTTHTARRYTAMKQQLLPC